MNELIIKTQIMSSKEIIFSELYEIKQSIKSGDIYYHTHWMQKYIIIPIGCKKVGNFC